MSEIRTKADKMAGIFFNKTERSARGMVRVQIRDKAGSLQVRKWSYKAKKFSQWAPL